MNKQISLSNLEDELSQVRTKKEFPEQIERIAPWNELVAMIKPCYYKGERGNKPYDLELMLRLYLIQNPRVKRHKTSAFLSIAFSDNPYTIITF